MVRAGATDGANTVRKIETTYASLNNMVRVRSLNEDVINEILSWLPANIVKRCECVCKSWRSMIQHRKFIEKHMNRGESTTFVPDLAIAYIDGLTLEFCEINKIYRVRNYTTNQVLNLPNPNENRYSFVMGYVKARDEYKVQYLYYKGYGPNIGMKLLALGNENIWRDIEIPFLNFKKAIDVSTLDGLNYILYLSNLGELRMIGFRFEDESFMEISTLEEIRDITGEKQPRFIYWDEKIAIGCLFKYAYHVWILLDSTKSKWEKRKIVFPSNVLNQNPEIMEKFDPFSVNGRWLYLFLDNRKKNVAYDIEREIFYKGANIPYSVQNSIVSIKGMAPEKSTPSIPKRSSNFQNSIVSIKGMVPEKTTPPITKRTSNFIYKCKEKWTIFLGRRKY